MLPTTECGAFKRMLYRKTRLTPQTEKSVLQTHHALTNLWKTPLHWDCNGSAINLEPQDLGHT